MTTCVLHMQSLKYVCASCVHTERPFGLHHYTISQGTHKSATYLPKHSCSFLFTRTSINQLEYTEPSAIVQACSASKTWVH